MRRRPRQCTIGGLWIEAENKGTSGEVPVTSLLTLGYDPSVNKNEVKAMYTPFSH